MDIRTIITLLENTNTPEPDFDYYMTEGCGIFALALSRLIENGKIGILSRREGERWSKTIPEITHVFFWTQDKKAYDIKGERSFDDMAEDFKMSGNNWKGDKNYQLLGPFEPKDFYKKFMGLSDKKPLFGGETDIKEAEKLILQFKNKYNIKS